MEKFLALILTAIMLVQLSGCHFNYSATDQAESSDGQAFSQNAENGEHSEILKAYSDLTFNDMPEINTDLANIYVAGDNIAIIEFITPGLDSYLSTVVTYSLNTDKLMGTTTLGEGTRCIEPLADGGFYITNTVNGEISEYNVSCRKISSFTVDGIDKDISFTKLSKNEDKLLLGNSMNGNLTLYDIKTKKSSVIQTDKPIFKCMGATNEHFIVLDNENNLYTISNNGNISQMYINNTANYNNSSYAVDLKGDYITFLPLIKSEPIMVKVNSSSEIISAAAYSTVLTHTQTDDYHDILYFYNTNRMSIYSLPVNGRIISTALTYDGYAIAIIKESEDKNFSFKIFDPELGEIKPLVTQKYDRNAIDGVQPLPAIQGSSDFKKAIEDIQNKYGVRIMYQNSDFFDIETLGYTIKDTDEETVYKKLGLVTQFLDFLPEGTFKQAGGSKPLVLYLCDGIYPYLGGLNAICTSYNVSFVDISTTDSIISLNIAHELAHAIENNVSYDILDGWVELMPEEVQNAYGNDHSEAEFTPCDENNSPIWFVDPYGKVNEFEDRATVFEAIYADYLNGSNRINSDGLKQKAKYWKIILSETYDSCKNTDLLNW